MHEYASCRVGRPRWSSKFSASVPDGRIVTVTPRDAFLPYSSLAKKAGVKHGSDGIRTRDLRRDSRRSPWRGAPPEELDGRGEIAQAALNGVPTATQTASVLQALGFRGDVTVFRLNAPPRPKTGSDSAFRRNEAERVYLFEAAHNPEVAGSNPAPATYKGPGNRAFSA